MIFAILLLSSRSPRDVNSNLRFGTKLPKLENLPIIWDFYLFLWVLGGSKYGWTEFEVSKQMAIGRSYVLKSCSGAANSQCSGHFESCSTFTIGTNKVWIWIKKNYAFLFIFKKKGSRRWKPKKETIAPAASNACLYHHSKLDHIRCSQKSSWTASGPRSLGTTVKNCTGAMRYPRLKEIKDQQGLLGVGYPYMIYNIVSWLAPMGSKPFGFGHLQFVWGILARSCSIIYIYIIYILYIYILYILYNYT